MFCNEITCERTVYLQSEQLIEWASVVHALKPQAQRVVIYRNSV